MSIIRANKLETLDGKGEGLVSYPYEAGLEITSHNTIVREGDSEYKLAESIPLPYTTTGAGLPEGGAFVAVGDAVLRQELSQSGQGKGADLIGGLPFVTPQMFGAKADGTTDDSGALQAAIDAAALRGKTCYIPRLGAPYFVSSTIYLPSGTSIESNGATILAPTRTVSTTLGTGNTSLLVFENSDTVNGNSDISIRGLIIDGGWPSDAPGVGPALSYDDVSNLINLVNTDNIVFDGVSIVNFISCSYNPAGLPEEMKGSYSSVRFYSCSNISFVNCRQINSQFEGVWFHRSTNVFIDNFYSKNKRTSTPLHLWYCEGVKLLNSVLDESETTRQGSTVNLYSSNVVVSNTTFINSKGLDLGNEVYVEFSAHNILISGCTFVDCSIYAAGHEDLDIDGLTIDSNTLVVANKSIYGLVNLGGVSNAIISNNTITAETASTVAIYLHQNATHMQGITRNTLIKGNMLRGFRHALQISASDTHGFEGLHFIDNVCDDTSGVRLVTESGGFLKKFRMSGNSISGSSNPSSSFSVYDGWYCGFGYTPDSTFHDLNGSETLEDVVIENNYILDSGAWVMIFPSADGLVQPPKNIKIRNNHFDATATGSEQGVRIRSSEDAEVSGNLLVNAQVSFIRVDSPDGVLRIENNNCKNRDIIADHLFRMATGDFTGVLTIKGNRSDRQDTSISRASSTTFTPSHVDISANWPETYAVFTPTDFGATADRPSVSAVSIGHRYFDTTLGKPVYSTGTGWVDSAGVIV